MTLDCRLVRQQCRTLWLWQCVNGSVTVWMCDTVNVMNLMVLTWYRPTSVTHDSVLMVPFSCSHRPDVCITRPNCKARPDKIWDKWLANFHILTKLNYLSTLYVCRYQCTVVGRWATVMYGRVGKLKTRVGKRKAPNFIKQMFAHPGVKSCRHPCITVTSQPIDIRNELLFDYNDRQLTPLTNAWSSS